MGTNYYHHEDPCPQCGRGSAEHIGKSSAGWCFSLHVLPEAGIHDWQDWRQRLVRGGVIRDEYGTEISLPEFELVVTLRGWKRANPFDYEWLTKNHAAQGPHGLARHKIDGIRCIGHGAGTWDLIIGDFS